MQCLVWLIEKPLRTWPATRMTSGSSRTCACRSCCRGPSCKELACALLPQLKRDHLRDAGFIWVWQGKQHGATAAAEKRCEGGSLWVAAYGVAHGLGSQPVATVEASICSCLGAWNLLSCNSHVQRSRMTCAEAIAAKAAQQASQAPAEEVQADGCWICVLFGLFQVNAGRAS